MLVGDDGSLTGLFTDSDLARLFESRRDEAFDGPIRDVMSPRPTTVTQGSMMIDAVAIMAERKISELPVVDDEGRPVGMIDITDVVSMIPESTPLAEPPRAIKAPKMLQTHRTPSHARRKQE
jgi:arabinose-5-phosphate isomerase